jgi:hypothetical protein
MDYSNVKGTLVQYRQHDKVIKNLGPDFKVGTRRHPSVSAHRKREGGVLGLVLLLRRRYRAYVCLVPGHVLCCKSAAAVVSCC